MKKSEVTVLDFTVRGKEPGLGIGNGGGPAPLIDVFHRLLWLMEHDRTKLGPFLDEAKVDTGRLRLLANALKGRALSGGSEGEERTEEQKAVDRLLAQWKRVVESRALPLLDERR